MHELSSTCILPSARVPWSKIGKRQQLQSPLKSHLVEVVGTRWETQLRFMKHRCVRAFRKSSHLTDHCLSFSVNRHLPNFRKIMQSRLDMVFHGDHGFDSLGAFVHGSGQVRKMASHLLQIIALTTAEPLPHQCHSPEKINIFWSVCP